MGGGGEGGAEPLHFSTHIYSTLDVADGESVHHMVLSSDLART